MMSYYYLKMVIFLLAISKFANARDSRQFFGAPFDLVNPYGKHLMSQTVAPFHSSLVTVPEIGRNPSVQNVHNSHLATESKLSSKITDRFIWYAQFFTLDSSTCKNNWIEPLLGRCCAQSNACSEDKRSETITLCQDVPVPNEAAVSSAPTGTIEGIGVHNYVCFAVVMAHPPNSRIQVSCPVLNVTSPINVQIFDPVNNYLVMQPYPMVKDVSYTTLKNVVYLGTRMTSSEDRFTCNWKAIP